MKLMADNYEDDHLKTAPDHANHKPSPDQVYFNPCFFWPCWQIVEGLCSFVSRAAGTLTEPFL